MLIPQFPVRARKAIPTLTSTHTHLAQRLPASLARLAAKLGSDTSMPIESKDTTRQIRQLHGLVKCAAKMQLGKTFLRDIFGLTWCDKQNDHLMEISTDIHVNSEGQVTFLIGLSYHCIHTLEVSFLRNLPPKTKNTITAALHALIHCRLPACTALQEYDCWFGEIESDQLDTEDRKRLKTEKALYKSIESTKGNRMGTETLRKAIPRCRLTKEQKEWSLKLIEIIERSRKNDPPYSHNEQHWALFHPDERLCATSFYVLTADPKKEPFAGAIQDSIHSMEGEAPIDVFEAHCKDDLRKIAEHADIMRELGELYTNAKEVWKNESGCPD